MTFDEQVRALIRPSGNPSHLKQLLHVMEQMAPERKTAAGPIFHDLAERLKKRGIVLVFSDLFDSVPAILAGLKHFRHRRHEVVLFHVLDPAELDFPFQQMTLFKGLEQFPTCWPSRMACAAPTWSNSATFSSSPRRLPRTPNRLRANPHRSTAGHCAIGVFDAKDGRGEGNLKTDHPTTEPCCRSVSRRRSREDALRLFVPSPLAPNP